MPDNVTPLRDYGSNQPPDPLDDKQLKARLEVDYQQTLRRFVELEQGAARITAPGNEDAAQRIVDFIAQQARPLTAEAKQAHDREKKPYRLCGKAVDDFFLRRIDKFTIALGRVDRLLEAYHRRKKVEAAERDRAEREAAAKAQAQAEAEAARLAAEAAAKAAAGQRRAAIDLETAARRHQEHAAEQAAILAAAAAPVRIHGDYGATAFSTAKWVWDAEDPTLIPLGYLKPDDAAIQAAIDEGIRDIPGLRIHLQSRFVVRRC